MTIAVDRSNYVGLAHRIGCWRKRLARPVDRSCRDVPDLPNGACLFAGFPFLIMPMICVRRLFSFCGKTPNLQILRAHENIQSHCQRSGATVSGSRRLPIWTGYASGHNAVGGEVDVANKSRYDICRRYDPAGCLSNACKPATCGYASAASPGRCDGQ